MRRTLKLLFQLSFLCTFPLWAGEDREVSSTTRNWDQFVYPEVVVNDKDNGTSKGSQLVQELFPDLEGDIQEIAKGVCQLLYRPPAEVPHFEQLTFELEYRDGVAYKAGESPRILINLSTRYLEEQYNQLGNDGVIYEIQGVNWHELTHGYQHVPQNCGDYKQGSDFFGFIEGTADAVRILAGYHSSRTPYPGGHWRDGYTTTGFFLEWIQKNIDTDFLYKLNQSCLDIDPWSFEAAFDAILGEPVETLWNRYQWFLQGGGSEAVALFDVNQTVVCKEQVVQCINKSFNAPEEFSWLFEGAAPSTSSDENPEISYYSPGTYSLSLTASNSYGSTTEEKKEYIHVADRFGEMKRIVSPSGIIGAPDVFTFPGEDFSKLIDNNSSTKMCTKAGNVTFEYHAEDTVMPYAYTITSGPDAQWRDPFNWTVSGSLDGINWEILDIQHGIVFDKRKEEKLFVVDHSENFLHYRWEMEGQNDTMLQFSEFQIYGIDSTDNSVATAVSRSSKEELSLSLNAGQLQLNFGEVVPHIDVSLFKLNGSEIVSTTVHGSSKFTLNHTLPAGIYLVRVKSQSFQRGRSIVRKVIVQ